MDNLSQSKLADLKNVDIKNVDPDTLIDIHNVKINMELSEKERILDFIEQIKNPYCFKCGDIIVKLTFQNEEGDSLEQQFKNYLNSL